MKKVKYNDKYILIDDSPLDIKKTGALWPNNLDKKENLDDTMKVSVISKEELLEDTITDLWGDSRE